MLLNVLALCTLLLKQIVPAMNANLICRQAAAMAMILLSNPRTSCLSRSNGHNVRKDDMLHPQLVRMNNILVQLLFMTPAMQPGSLGTSPVAGNNDGHVSIRQADLETFESDLQPDSLVPELKQISHYDLKIVQISTTADCIAESAIMPHADSISELWGFKLGQMSSS